MVPINNTHDPDTLWSNWTPHLKFMEDSQNILFASTKLHQPVNIVADEVQLRWTKYSIFNNFYYTLSTESYFKFNYFEGCSHLNGCTCGCQYYVIPFLFSFSVYWSLYSVRLWLLWLYQRYSSFLYQGHGKKVQRSLVYDNYSLRAKWILATAPWE